MDRHLDHASSTIVIDTTYGACFRPRRDFGRESLRFCGCWRWWWTYQSDAIERAIPMHSVVVRERKNELKMIRMWLAEWMEHIARVCSRLSD